MIKKFLIFFFYFEEEVDYFWRLWRDCPALMEVGNIYVFCRHP